MNPARRGSVLLMNQLCVSSRGGTTAKRPFSPGAVSAPAGARYCYPGGGGGGGGVRGTCPQLKPSTASIAGAAAGNVTLHLRHSTGYSSAVILTAVTRTGLSTKLRSKMFAFKARLLTSI